MKDVYNCVIANIFVNDELGYILYPNEKNSVLEKYKKSVYIILSVSVLINDFLLFK